MRVERLRDDLIEIYTGELCNDKGELIRERAIILTVIEAKQLAVKLNEVTGERR